MVEDDSLDERNDCASPSPKQQCIDSVPECYDLARYTGTAIYLSDADKYELLANPFRPGADYKFQKSATERALSFQYRCNQLNPWLA